MSYGGQQNRTEWYDRAPTIKGAVYAATSVVPHGTTARWSYTVPASRKALIEAATAVMTRLAAASAPAEVLALVQIPAAPSYVVVAQLYNNAASVSFNGQLAGAVILLAGNTLSALTADASPDGTMAYNLSFKGTEYDA